MHPKSRPARPLRALLVAGALCAAAAPAAAQETPTAREVLERYVDAIGGREAIEAQRFRRTVAEMETGNGMTMRAVTLQATPDRIATRMEIPALGVSVRQGFDGSVGWSLNPMQGATLVEGEALEQMRRQADMHAELHPEAVYESIEMSGRGEVGGRPCWEVRMVAATGAAVGCYDVETGLLLGSTSRQEGPEGSVTGSTRFYDYEAFDGVLQPTRAESETSMGQSMTMRIVEISHEPIADAEFALPPEIEALVDRRGDG